MIRINQTIDMFAQDWMLNQLGDWSGFKQDANGTGNWPFDQSRVHNAANEITSITGTGEANWVDPVHDPAGNMTLMPKPGEETTALACVYDAWNRLTRVNADANTVQVNSYDGLNRRIQRIVSQDANTGYDYYYRGWQVLEERENAAAAPREQYVWDLRYIHAPVRRFLAAISVTSRRLSHPQSPLRCD